MKIKLRLLILSFVLMNTAVIFSEGTADAAEENVSKYSQRNDGYIDLNSVVHEETPEYRIADGNNVRLILKTKNNDVHSVEAIYNGNSKNMRGIGNYGGDEIFTVEIPAYTREYYFKITDSKTRYFVGREITKDESKVEKFQYEKSDRLTSVPDWARGSVGYQIYIDSFRNGNVDNDAIFNEFGIDDFSAPTGELRSGASKRDLVAGQWGDEGKSEFALSEWNSNYEAKNEWEEGALNDVQNYTRYYGGDLEGIKEKLDYLKELGVEYIVLSSPFYSLSNHKYDTIYFNHVDPFFGNIEQTGTSKGLDIQGRVHNNNGDKELNLLIYNPSTKRNLLEENLSNPDTWVWTDSDLEFASLVKEAHSKGLKVILEISPDITSDRFFARTDKSHGNWYLDAKDLRLDLGKKEVRAYIENSLKKWVLGPDNRFKENSIDDGIDGIRYVYYDKRNKQHLVDITENLKKYKKDMLILGDYSLSFTEDIDAGIYDSGADYSIINNIVKYTVNSNSNYRIGSVEFASKMNEIYSKYSRDRFSATQMHIGSLDTDRIFSGLININRVFDRNNQSNQGYMNIRPDLYDGTAIPKMKRIVSLQMMLPLTPVIYYGDEKGMWGSDSPRNRKPMIWEDYAPYENETDDISKYSIDRLRNLSSDVEINEVQKIISYPVRANSEIENHYRALLKVRKNHRNLFRNGKFRILEVYEDGKTRPRIDAEISHYLSEQARKSKVYQGRDINPPRPHVDFLSYEVYDSSESMIVVVNNSTDSYPVTLNVPKLFGFYRNQLNEKENYSISDKKIKITLQPYEVKVLYSSDKNIFDSFK